jgi:hypothetical protein
LALERPVDSVLHAEGLREALTFLELIDYNMLMARPRKEGRLRMDTDLRIPLTSEQKALIDEATADEPEGKAAWARALLLAAARRKLAKIRTDNNNET